MPETDKEHHSYQSPITLDKSNIIKIRQNLHLHGENKCAEYNCESKIYEVKDNIVLRIRSKYYRLLEYHFHVPGEHIIDHECYKSEIHYVFVEITDDLTPYSREQHFTRDGEFPDVCSCKMPHNPSNILVIGRVITNSEEKECLEKIKVKEPEKYFMYDGSLTTGNYAPVRWIVGQKPVDMNIEEIEKIAKKERPIQKLDGRIILYVDE